MVGKQSNATKNISLKMLSRKIYNQKIVTDVRKIRSQSKLSHILSNKKKPKVVRKAIKVDATRSNKASRMVGKKNNTIKTISSKRQSRKIDHRKNVSSSRKTRSQTKLIDIMSVKKKSKVGPKKKINILERKPIKVDAARSSRNQRTSNVLNCASEDGKDTKGTKEKIDSIKYKEMSEKRTRIRPVPYWLNETRIKYVRLPNGCCEIAKHSDETSVEETKDPKKNMKTSRQKLSISDENTLEPNSIHSSPQEDDSSSWLTVEEKIYFGQGNSCTSLFASSPRSLSVDVNRSQFRVMASDEPEKSERNISSSTNMGPEKLTSAKPASAIVVEQNIDYEQNNISNHPVNIIPDSSLGDETDLSSQLGMLVTRNEHIQTQETDILELFKPTINQKARRKLFDNQIIKFQDVFDISDKSETTLQGVEKLDVTDANKSSKPHEDNVLAGFINYFGSSVDDLDFEPIANRVYRAICFENESVCGQWLFLKTKGERKLRPAVLNLVGFVYEGCVTMTIDNTQTDCRERSVFHIPRGVNYRMQNNSESDVLILFIIHR